MNKNHSIYWDNVSNKLTDIFYTPEIFKHYWLSHIELIEKWLPLKKQIILKTDMYEESQYNRYFSYELSRKNKVIGIDISKNVLRKVKRKKGIHLVLCDVANLPFKMKSFDSIVSLSTLDNIPKEDISKSFKEIERVTKKDGNIFLTLDNRQNIIYYLESFFWKIINIYERTKLFTVEDVEIESKKSNLKVERFDSIMFFPPFIDKIIIAIEYFFPLTRNFLEKLSRVIVRRSKNKGIGSGRFLAFNLKKN